jgi:predicted peptidase
MLIKNYFIAFLTLIMLSTLISVRMYVFHLIKHDKNKRVKKRKVSMVKKTATTILTCYIPLSVIFSTNYANTIIFKMKPEQKNTSTFYTAQMTARYNKVEDEILEGKQTGSFTKNIANLDCYLNVPEIVKSNLPVVIFLHGTSERSIEKVKQLKPVTAVTDGTLDGLEDFIFVAPTAPHRGSWYQSEYWDTVIDLIDALSEEYSVNLNRIYITGFSAGANGVWGIINKYPDKFRAAVPVSGYNNITPENLINIPIYAIVGGYESGFKASMTRMVNSIQEAGGNVSLNIIPQANHSVTQSSYTTNELYTWLLSQ